MVLKGRKITVSLLKASDKGCDNNQKGRDAE